MKNLIFIFLFVICSLLSGICYAQWVQVSNGLDNSSVNSLAASGNNIFAGTPFGAYLSTNNGTNWTQTSLIDQDVYAFAVSGNYVFAGCGGSGVFLSTNNGATWTQTPLNNRTVASLAINGSNIFAGTFAGFSQYGVYKSTNNGTTWSQTSLNNQNVYALAVNGNIIFAGTEMGVYKSTNNGLNWTQTSLNNQYVSSLAVNGSNVFAGTSDGNGVYLSTNNGLNWIQTSLNNISVTSLAVNGNNIFVGTGYPGDIGVFVSNDNGANWTQRIEGFPTSFIIYALCMLNNHIFAGDLMNSGVWIRPLSELIGIQPISNEVPNQFSLSQNYPNPFNPSTIIRFNIKDPGFTTLKVYDILGREAATLVNEELKPGTYEADWNASNYPSGVYYYKLVTEDYTETRKMVLIK